MRARDTGPAEEPRRKAIALWKEAYELQQEGQLEEAIARYSSSIDVFPTAEAYTFRGWAKSFLGQIDEAIDDCKKAIAVDPDFGNPYNDIGSYLVRQGKLTDAVPWLEKAKKAPRYEPRHFPYLNLGRIYWAQGLVIRALSEFEQAVSLRPEDPTAAEALRSLRLQIH